MIQLLADNPLLLLFVRAAISYPLGRVKITGTGLGAGSIAKLKKELTYEFASSGGETSSL